MTNEKLSRAKAASEYALREKTAARDAAIQAISRMLKSLETTLDGTSLMGLPNLGRSSLPYRGVRAMSRNADEPLPRAENGVDGREVLCLSMKGQLEFASCAADLSLKVRPAAENEYRAEWPEDIAEAILSAIEYHLEGADASAERYMRLRRLSYRLSEALTEEQP